MLPSSDGWPGEQIIDDVKSQRVRLTAAILFLVGDFAAVHS
jgi:hypothetical protein